MLRLAAVCVVVLSGQTLLAQDFRLFDAASRTNSNARLTAQQLQITNNGTTTNYDRAKRHDAAGYTAYANAGMRRVIRWPNSNRGRMQIGEVSGLRMTFRPSQMEIFPLNPGLPPGLPGGGMGNAGVYQLRKRNESGSAVVTAASLTLRIGIQQAIYNRDRSLDAPGYHAYVNASLAERVIRWPVNLRDPILIGQQIGNQLLFRKAIMRVVGGAAGGGATWQAETNLDGRPVARSMQALPANQPISIRVVAMAPGRSIGVGRVGGQSFEKTWTPTQFAIGAALTFTPTVASRYGIGVGTATAYDKVVVSQRRGATRLTFDGGTILDIERAGSGQWQRVATLGGIAARSKDPYAVGDRLRLHVITSVAGSIISLHRAGANVVDKSWNNVEAPTGASLTYITPVASHLEISVRANLAPQDVTVTALPTATRLTFADGTVLDVK